MFKVFAIAFVLAAIGIGGVLGHMQMQREAVLEDYCQIYISAKHCGHNLIDLGIIK